MEENMKFVFTEMHKKGNFFILPTAWDVASALLYEKAGFKAIGTTSWGIAASSGYSDGEVLTFQEMFSMVKLIIKSVSIPVTVDIESGYSENIEDILQNVEVIANAGAVGINIEDSIKKGKSNSNSLRFIEQQCDIIKSIKKMLMEKKQNLFINARTDGFISNCNDPLAESIKRGNAYITAGADCIFVPGMKNTKDIEIFSGKINAPINIMASPNLPDNIKLKSLGVTRLSLGSAAWKASMGHLNLMVNSISNNGDISLLFDLPMPELNLKSIRKNI
jgi:2-methylisocitrate lyase-like PEP mutase family enzyme